jgi:hypothetical protein
MESYFGFEGQPRSQRVAAMQRRDADRPLFNFWLPIDRAMADVEKLLGPRNKRRRNKDYITNNHPPHRSYVQISL